MQDTEFLFVVAEIAVAFTGFAGLVAVLARRADGDHGHERLNSSRLQSSLFISLLTAGSALLPYLPYRIGFTEEVSYRLAAIVVLVVSSSIFFQVTVQQWNDYSEAGVKKPVSYKLNSCVYFSHLVILAFCITDQLSYEYYLIALFLLLYTSATGFMRVFVSLARANLDQVREREPGYTNSSG